MDYVYINLESIREYFPELERFIAKLTYDEVELIKDKHGLDISPDLIIECASNIWSIVVFGEFNNNFEIETSIESLEDMVEWLGCQNKKDTDILMMSMNMTDDLDYIDEIIYQLYKVLADTLREVE